MRLSNPGVKAGGIRTLRRQLGTPRAVRGPMFDAMRFVNRWVVPRHVAELDARLAALLPALSTRRRRRNAVRRSLEGRPSSALHALAALAEAEGWLDPAETMTIRKLAHRVSVVLARGES